MKGARGWIAIGLVAVLVAVVAYLVQPHQSSPDHSSSSDAADGTSAARLFSQAMGHPTEQIAGTFPSSDRLGLMFVFTPTSPYTSADAQATVAWVRAGGVLIYASEQGDPELDSAFEVRRLGGFAPAGVQVGTPVAEGVTEISGAGTVIPLDPLTDQVPVTRTADGLVTSYLERIGSGTVVVMSDPLVLCNGYLDQRDNGRFLSDLLGLAGPTARVGFDEYHHGLIVSDFAPQSWLTTAWGLALLWMLVAIFFGLLLRGRRLGPLVPRPAEAARSDVEWSVAVGELLRRSGGREVTLGLLAGATERAVASRAGLPVQPREQFWNALWMRAPEVATELAATENDLQHAAHDDRQLLDASRRLHHIAYPVTEERRRGSRLRRS